jgi:hypothetical protein
MEMVVFVRASGNAAAREPYWRPNKPSARISPDHGGVREALRRRGDDKAQYGEATPA